MKKPPKTWGSPATLITYIGDTDLYYTFYEGHRIDMANMRVIWSIGSNPLRAIRALGKARRWGRLDNFQVMPGGNTAYTWGFRFTADGTGMKAAGIHVPGGVILTWWK